MLQSAMDLQTKHKSKLPPDFPFVSQKHRTFKELTETMIHQLDYLLSNQESIFKFCKTSLLENGFEEQMTFNEGDRSHFFTQCGTEDDILRLKTMLHEKVKLPLPSLNNRQDMIIQSMQRSTHRSQGADNLQQRYDMLETKLMEMQAQLKEKDMEIDQLQIRLYQKEWSRDDQSSQIAPTPHPYPLTNRTLNQRSNSTQHSQQLSKSIDMPLKLSSNARQFLHHNPSQSLNLTTRHSFQDPFHSNTHQDWVQQESQQCTLRCKVQAAMIETLIKEKEVLQMEVKNNANNINKEDVKHFISDGSTKTNNPNIVDLHHQLKQLYSALFTDDQQINENDLPTESMISHIKSEIENLRSKLSQQPQSRFSALIVDRDIQFVNNNTYKTVGNKVLDTKSMDEVEKLHQQLTSELNNERVKCEQLQQAFNHIQNIFQDNEEQSENDAKILEEIRCLNQKYIMQYVESEKKVENLKKVNDELKLEIESLREALKSQQMNTSQTNIGKSGNAFKRNTAIKKVQGFFQQQLSTLQSNPLLLQSPSPLNSERIESTTTPLLFKQDQKVNPDTSQLNTSVIQNHQQIALLNELKETIASLEKQVSLKDLELKEMQDRFDRELGDYPKLKQLLEDEKGVSSKLQEAYDQAQNKIEELSQEIEKMKDSVKECNKEYNQLVDKYEEQKGKLVKMQEAQKDLKQLIEEERLAYNDDRDKYEIDFANLKQAADTKIKIIKTKLSVLFDGNKDQAQQLSIEELIDHISFRINQGRSSSPTTVQRRSSSLQSRISNVVNQNDYNTQKDDYPMHYELKVPTNSQMHRRFSAMRPQNVQQHQSKDSLLRSSLLLNQDHMTKIIELCQVQNNQVEQREIPCPIQNDFIQSNISPIKRVQTLENEIITTEAFDQVDQKENRIMPVDVMRQSRRKQQAFLQTNMNHQNASYPMKQQPLVQTTKENYPRQLPSQNYIQRRTTYHQSNYDMPLQIKPTNLNSQQQLRPSNFLSPTAQSLNSTSKLTIPRNENLTSIIENFRREKTVFNKKFQELKQKLEHFSSPQRSQRECSFNRLAHKNMEGQRSEEMLTSATTMNDQRQSAIRMTTMEGENSCIGHTPARTRTQIRSGYE